MTFFGLAQAESGRKTGWHTPTRNFQQYPSLVELSALEISLFKNVFYSDD